MTRWREFAQGLEPKMGQDALAALATRCRVSRSIGSALKWAGLFNAQPKGELFNLISSNRLSEVARISMKTLRDYNHFLAIRRREKNERISRNIQAEQPSAAKKDATITQVFEFMEVCKRHGIISSPQFFEDTKAVFST